MISSRSLARAFAMVLLALLSLAAGALYRVASAQVTTMPVTMDSVCFKPLRAAIDSLGKLHLKSTVLTQYQVRAAITLTSVITDSCLIPAPPPPPPPPDSTPVIARITVEFDHTTTTHWSSGAIGRFANDNEFLCASVDVGGVRHLGSSVVATRIRADSLQWRVLPDTGATLRARCAKYPWSTATIWPITWSAYAVQMPDGLMSTVKFPFADPVVP